MSALMKELHEKREKKKTLCHGTVRDGELRHALAVRTALLSVLIFFISSIKSLPIQGTTVFFQLHSILEDPGPQEVMQKLHLVCARVCVCVCVSRI